VLVEVEAFRQMPKAQLRRESRALEPLLSCAGNGRAVRPFGQIKVDWPKM